MFSACSYSSSVQSQIASIAILQDVGNVVFQKWKFHTSFTGKERDSETGYCYFGARYYDSGIPNIFLSVDPMVDKYPSISPYAYCAWNPIRLVDPDGREVVFAGEEEKKLYTEYRAMVFSDDKYKAIQKELINLEESEDVFCIRMGENKTNNEGSANFIYNVKNSQFDVNISNDNTWTNIEKISHELKHADQYLNRKLTFLYPLAVLYLPITIVLMMNLRRIIDKRCLVIRYLITK